jgi:nitrous oxidase accessory protein NosD
MHALQRTAAVLIWTAIAWLGAACDQVDTPTEPGPSGLVTALATTTRWVNDDDPNGGLYVPPGTSCTDPGYMTISAAVAAASSGDIIQVCAGTYNESVRITQPLTLLGPNAGVSWDGVRGSEATVTWPVFNTFDITDGDDVTIDGFTINGGFIGIAVIVSSNNLLIQSNITTGGLRALSLDAPGSNLSVLNNDLISNTRSLHVDGAYTNMVISGNRFSGPAATTGIAFTGGTPPNSIAGFEFTDNEVLHRANMASNISNATVSGNTFDAVLAGNENLLISLQNSTVTDNIFEGDDANACLLLWGSQFGLVASDHVTISDNTFSDCGTAADPSSNFAIQLSQDVHHIDIKNNEISSGIEGVNTDDTAPWDVTDEVHINFNNITDNTSFGVRNGQMGVLDAECNWWGAADGPGPVGPGSGDNVSNNVDFRPWLIAPAPGGPCAGGFPSGGTVNGGGQINVDGGRGSFGFSANAARQRGHLDYMNHDNRDHLNCTVDEVVIISETEAHLEGTCSSKSYTGDFEADVEDNGEPGKNSDKFTIMYGGNPPEGGTLRSGNIQIH